MPVELTLTSPTGGNWGSGGTTWGWTVTSASNTILWPYNAERRWPWWSPPPVLSAPGLPPDPFTDAVQAAAAAERQLAHRRRAEQRSAERQVAATRARELLEMLLGEEERARLAAHQLIRVHGSDGGLFELSSRSYMGNVRKIRLCGAVCDITSGPCAGHTVSRWCAHPDMETERGPLPVADALVAQLLALQTDEAGFLAVANRHE